MPNASRIVISEIDASFNIAGVLKGISFVQGVTKRGPISDPSEVILSWEDFVKTYGGYLATSDFPLICKRAFDYGSQLRVSRVAHYTDVSDKSTLTADTAVVNNAKVLTFSGDLITGNVVNLTINGVTVNTAFNTDNNTTIEDLIDDIDTTMGYKASIIPATDYRAIVIWPSDNTALTITTSDVTGGASQATIAVTNSVDIREATSLTPLFSFTMKNPGADYNNIFVEINTATNGSADYFDLGIYHAQEPALNEVYQNLKINGNPTVNNSDYLSVIAQQSKLLTPVYRDLSSTTGQLVPGIFELFYNTGSDGDPIVAADYVGDSAGKTGFYSFDNEDDGYQISAPEISDNTVHVGGSAYSASRKDLVYLAHLSNTNLTASALISARNTTNIDSSYTAFFAGGLKVLDPITSQQKNISELGDVMGLAANSDNFFGEWYSFAGTQRGIIRNALGVVNNFGNPANYNALNLISNSQINMVIQEDGITYLKGNFTAQRASSRTSFLNTRRFLIYLKKLLTPTLKRYIEEPCDIPSFKALWLEVKPVLDDLASANKRALFDYRWVGGQQYNTIEEVIQNTSNTENDIDQGKYKVKLYLKIIPSMQEIGLDLIITRTSVDFNEF